MLGAKLRFLNGDVTESAVFFSDYIKNTEQSIIKGQQDLQKKAKKAIQAESEYADEMQNSSDDAGHRQHYIFNPNLLYNSLFITFYSYFENRMKEISIYFDDLYDNLEKIPSRNIIGFYKDYLFKHHYSDFSEVQSEWDIINDFQKIRNNIVHSNGVILNDETKKTIELNEALNKYPSIKVWQKTFWIIDSEILFQFNDTIRNFLTKVITKISIPPLPTDVVLD